MNRQLRKSYFISKGFAVSKCQGGFARRNHVEREIQKTGVVYVTGVGHGSPSEFTGDSYNSVFEVGNYSSTEVSGKIIHLLSCQVGASLGPDFVLNGCLTFFGYEDDFVFLASDQDTFFECDSEIDRAFADGMTAEQVYIRVEKLFKQRIADFRDQGKQTQAAMLDLGLQRLRCPTSPITSISFGDPQAKLSLS